MDLNSINANVNRLLSNIWAIISFFKEFAVDSAKDVSITYLNADGSESTKTFPNVAKIVQACNLKNDNGKLKDLNGNSLTLTNSLDTNYIKVTGKIYGRNEVFEVDSGALIDIVRVVNYDFSTFMVTATTRRGANAFISARVVMSKYGATIVYDLEDIAYGEFEAYADEEGSQKLRFKQNSDSLVSVQLAIIPIGVSNGGNTYYIGNEG